MRICAIWMNCLNLMLAANSSFLFQHSSSSCHDEGKPFISKAGKFLVSLALISTGCCHNTLRPYKKQFDSSISFVCMTWLGLTASRLHSLHWTAPKFRKMPFEFNPRISAHQYFHSVTGISTVHQQWFRIFYYFLCGIWVVCFFLPVVLNF